jgi:hypothetical protein
MTTTLRLMLVAALALAGGCSGTKVYTNADPSADFSAYRTYGFAEKLGTDTDQYTSLTTKFLKAAASRELEARGYEPSEQPDLLVNFSILTQQKLQTTTTPSYYDYRYDYGPWGGYGAYETRVSEYTEGTLNVDLVDRRLHQLVWEGAVVGRVTEEVRKDMQKAIDGAMTDLFEEFPYTAGAGGPGSGR